MVLDAGPAAESFNEPIHVDVEGLVPGRHVVVQALATDDSGKPWKSWARFTADGSGAVDLARAVPERGTYQVADAAGLLWSLEPAFAAAPDAQYVTRGFSVQVQVVVGGKVEAEQTLVRSSPTASRRLTVPQTGFDGSLFLPADSAPGMPAPPADSAAARPDAPLVVVIGGSGGGEWTLEAAALAASGYPTLALAYFGEPGLPRCLCEIPLEYFAHAVAWLRAQPAYATRPLVLVGSSRGGEGALAIASYEPTLFDAVVAQSPSAYLNGPYGPGSRSAQSAWTLGGQPLTDQPIPVAGLRAPLLLTAGGADTVWDSAASARAVMRELDAAPGAPPHSYLYYAGAGHGAVGRPAYFPFNPAGHGGTPTANEAAAVSAWPQLLEFINSVRKHPATD